MLLAPSIHAQELSSSIAPSEYEVVARPGSTVRVPVTITNNADPMILRSRAYHVTISNTRGDYQLVPYYSDSPQLPVITTSSKEYGLDTPFLLDSREALEFDIILELPSDMREQDYIFAIVSESETSQGFSDLNRIQVQGGVGSLIYVSVSSDGLIKEQGTITQFDLQAPYSFRIAGKRYAFFDSLQEIPLVLRIGNTGPHLIHASGTLILNSSLTKEPLSIKLPETRVFAGTDRAIITEPIHLGYVDLFSIESYISIGGNPPGKPQMVYGVVFPFISVLLVGAIFITGSVMYILIKYVKKTRT